MNTHGSGHHVLFPQLAQRWHLFVHVVTRFIQSQTLVPREHRHRPLRVNLCARQSVLALYHVGFIGFQGNAHFLPTFPVARPLDLGVSCWQESDLVVTVAIDDSQLLVSMSPMLVSTFRWGEHNVVHTQLVCRGDHRAVASVAPVVESDHRDIVGG